MARRRSEKVERAAVVDEAWSWEGTPWRHNQAVKGVGVDCGRFLIECYVRAGVIPPFDAGNYARQWNFHRSEEIYLGHVKRFAREVRRNEAGPGDCILYRYGRTYSHGGIIVDPPIILHAYVRRGVTQGSYMDGEEELRDQGLHFPRYFSLWGK